MSKWRQEQKDHRDKGLDFMADGQIAGDKVVITRCLVEVDLRVKQVFLEISSPKYGRRQLQELKQTGRREYPIAILASGRVERDAHKRVTALLFSRQWPLSNGSLNTTFRSWVFRMLVRYGGSVNRYLVIPHRSCPTALFDLLNDDVDAAASRLSKLGPCEKDSLAKTHLTTYSTEALLKSTDSLQIVTFLAVIILISIVGRECGHAQWRRVSTMRGVQATKPSFVDMNAEQVARELRHILVEWSGVQLPDFESRSGMKNVAKMLGDVAGGGGVRGAGGAWHAYCHHMATGVRDPDWSDLALEYRALTASALAKYVELGRLATEARRAGNPHPFGLKASKLALRNKTVDELIRAFRDSAVSALEPHAVVPLGVLRSAPAGAADDDSSRVVPLVQTHDGSTLEELLRIGNALSKQTAIEEKKRELDINQELVEFARKPSPIFEELKQELPDLGRHIGQTLMPLPSPPDTASFSSCDHNVTASTVSTLAHCHAARTPVSSELDKWWDDNCEVIYQKDCRPIAVSVAVSPCLREGVCFCQGSGPDHHVLLMRLFHMLEVNFPKEMKFVYIDAHVVLELQTGDASVSTTSMQAPTTSDWLHVSFMNFSPKTFDFLRLENPRPGPTGDTIALDICTNADIGIWLDGYLYCKQHVDIEKQITVQCYRLLGDGAGCERELTTAEFCAADVEVVKVCEPCIVWRGKEMEGKSKANRDKRRREMNPANKSTAANVRAKHVPRKRARRDQASNTDGPPNVGLDVVVHDGVGGHGVHGSAGLGYGEGEHGVLCVWGDEVDGPQPDKDDVVSDAESESHFLIHRRTSCVLEPTHCDGGDPDPVSVGPELSDDDDNVPVDVSTGGDVPVEIPYCGLFGDAADVVEDVGGLGPHVQMEVDEPLEPAQQESHAQAHEELEPPQQEMQHAQAHGPLEPPQQEMQHAQHVLPPGPPVVENLRLKPPELYIVIGSYTHRITYNIHKDELIAYCGHHGYGKCRQTRACYEGSRKKKGMGRPLGYLVAWLTANSDANVQCHVTHKGLYKQFSPSYALRKAARLLLCEQVHAGDVMIYEDRQDLGFEHEPEEFDP
jgi:hypothetical protein